MEDNKNIVKPTENKSVETKPVIANTAPTQKPVEAKPATTADSKPQVKRQPFDKNRRPARRGGRRFKRPVSEFIEKVVDIARVTTVVKGGRRFSFSALVVIGNKKGKVGYGHGKANEVPDAIKKAIKDAQINLITVPIIDKRTVPHDQIGKFLSSKVLVKPAPKGKGIISSSAIRAVVELAGYTDIYTKSLGSRNKTNSVKATLAALQALRTLEQIAALRDKKPEEILG